MKAWQIVVIIVLGIALWYYEQNGTLPTLSDVTDEFESNDNSSDGGSVSNTPFSSVSDFTAAWALAIAPAENVNPAYNNPGGLNTPGDLGSVPAAGGDGNLIIGVFSSLEAGYAKLQGILNSYVTNHGDLTLLQATSRYITGQPGDGDPSSYAQSVLNEANIVAGNLGVDVNATLNSLVGK